MNSKSKKEKISVLFLFKENLEREIPQNLIENSRTLFICEDGVLAKKLPKERTFTFEKIAGLDGMMKSVWNQIEWLKRWSTIPIEDDKSFIELYTHRSLPLWYFAELYLHYPKHLLRIITLIDIFYLIREKYSIEQIILINPALRGTKIISKAARLAEIPLSIERGRGSTQLKGNLKNIVKKCSPIFSATFYIWKQLVSTMFMLSTKKLSWKKVKDYIHNGDMNPTENLGRVCIISHGSYWREAPSSYRGKSNELDMYWHRLIDELTDETGEKETAISILGAGPRSIHRRRTKWTKFSEFFLPFGDQLPYAPIKWFSTFGTWNRARKGAGKILKQRKRFLQNEEMKQSITYRGVNFYDEFYLELKHMFMLMLPWGIKIIEQALTAFEKLKPSVICLYAEAGGYGRAITYAAKLLGIKTVAIQHGLIFPHNYTYVHTEDEIKGKHGDPFPFTDKFLLYDKFVKNLLEKFGNYPSETLYVTGSHKMDNLLSLKEIVDPAQIKKDLGYVSRDKIAVIASRYSEIGSAFLPIVEAVEAIPRMHLIVKPHQAELPEYYIDPAQKAGAKKVKVVSNKENLFGLLLASDLLITVNSLAALEALIIEKPVMVVNLPNHLSVYVDAGIAVGIESYERILPEMKKILHADVGDLREKQEKFGRENAFMIDGQSAERIKAEIYEFANSWDTSTD